MLKALLDTAVLDMQSGQMLRKVWCSEKWVINSSLPDYRGLDSHPCHLS